VRHIFTDGTLASCGYHATYMDFHRQVDGDTLVVDTTFNDKTWLDRDGHHHSDELHVVERFTASIVNTCR